MKADISRRLFGDWDTWYLDLKEQRHQSPQFKSDYLMN